MAESVVFVMVGVPLTCPLCDKIATYQLRFECENEKVERIECHHCNGEYFVKYKAVCESGVFLAD